MIIVFYYITDLYFYTTLLLVQEEDDAIFSYNDYLKDTNITYNKIKNIGIYTTILDNSEVTAVFDGVNESNVCGDVFVLRYCPKLNDNIFLIVAEILHAQKMCPRCSSNYHSGFFDISYGNCVEIFQGKEEHEEGHEEV